MARPDHRRGVLARLTLEQDLARGRRLRRMHRAASGLLALMVALYGLTLLWPEPPPWLGYVRAFAEAATIGACADWFAVTALFRRPFGLPIPHTGLIPHNKDRIGVALGGFIADNFLTADILQAKLRRLELGRWGAVWLQRPENAALVAGRLIELAPELLALSTPEARGRFVGALAADVAAAAPAAPLAAAVLRAVGRGDQRNAIVDAGLSLAARFLTRNQDLLRRQVASRTFRWLPKWIDERIAGSLLNALSKTIEEVRDPEHPWRARIFDDLDGFITRLEADSELAARAERIKHQLLAHPALQDRFGALAGALESWLRPETDDEKRARLERLTIWLTDLGAWLGAREETVEIFNDWLRRAIESSVAPRRRDIGQAIASVVAAWDARSVAEKLELQIGADLQYIRINGTLVGGLVGLALFIVSTWLPHPH
jgi:uncharacterized membrane-anchored protein YjiN (DUF445 family)